MARTRVPITVIDTAGNAVAGASVTVKIRATGVNATVYQNETGGTTITNPVSCNSQGIAPGWVERGAYRADITGTGITPYTEYFEAAPAGNTTIDNLWLPSSVAGLEARMDDAEDSISNMDPLVNIAYDARILNMQSIRGNHELYNNYSVAVPCYQTNANTVPMRLSYTPPVNCWWRVTANWGIIQKQDAAYHYQYCAQVLNTADADGHTQAQVITTQHASVNQHQGWTVTRTWKLTGGVAYNVTMWCLGLQGGAWGYYMGPAQLWIEGMAFAR